MRPSPTSVLLALATAALGACVDALPPATTLTSGPTAITPREAVVTFVRPSSPCDAGEYAVVVDDQGHFVGNVGPDTQLQFPTTPGEHHFYAWSNVDLFIDKVPGFNPVAAVNVKATAGESAYVVLDTPKPCPARIQFEMYAVNDSRSAQDELKGWLASTRPVLVDRDVGQRDLLSRPAHLREYLQLGASKLRTNEATVERRDLYKALDREASYAE